MTGAYGSISSVCLRIVHRDNIYNLRWTGFHETLTKGFLRGSSMTPFRLHVSTLCTGTIFITFIESVFMKLSLKAFRVGLL